MDIAQGNFDRAVTSAQDSLNMLQGGGVELARQSTRRLQSLVWDLEAIGAAVRLELMNRETQYPVDLG